jgi:ABC-type protease/lipase transport system fused ATPase/permease subunit
MVLFCSPNARIYRLWIKCLNLLVYTIKCLNLLVYTIKCLNLQVVNQVLESTGLPKCLNLVVYTVEVSVITVGILQEMLEGSDTMFTLNQFLACPLCGLIIKINISIAKICIWILSNALYIKHYTFTWLQT